MNQPNIRNQLVVLLSIAFLSVLCPSSDAFTQLTTRTRPISSISSRERTRIGAFFPSKIVSSVGDWIERAVTGTAYHWYQNPIIATIGIAFGIFVTGIGQGAAAVLNFRKHYADAPLPKVPCHGVVLNNQTDQNSQEDPLRLLVIGDSLAIGVGQTMACTPVLPETIASVISSAVKRPVFWTCFGETGASTPFILKMMNQPDSQAFPDFRAAMEKCGTIIAEKDDENLQNFTAQGTYISKRVSPPRGENDLLPKWQERLYKYRQSFDELYLDADSWEPFDIVILLTGTPKH